MRNFYSLGTKYFIINIQSITLFILSGCKIINNIISILKITLNNSYSLDIHRTGFNSGIQNRRVYSRIVSSKHFYPHIPLAALYFLNKQIYWSDIRIQNPLVPVNIEATDLCYQIIRFTQQEPKSLFRFLLPPHSLSLSLVFCRHINTHKTLVKQCLCIYLWYSFVNSFVLSLLPVRLVIRRLYSCN